MSCKVKIINSCEIYGNKFVDRVLNFTDRDLTNDSFSAKVISMNGAVTEIQGIKVANKVLFPVDSIQNLRIGNYKIEYWADFSEFGKQLFAIENFQVTNKPCNCDDDADGVFVIEFKEVTIEVQLFKGIVNIGNLTDEERQKLADLENYDDTEIREEISEINEVLPLKVDKVDGYGLSENNFSDANLDKLENLENFDPTDINNALGNKVDKVANKGLSTNDYTTAEKNKLGTAVVISDLPTTNVGSATKLQNQVLINNTLFDGSNGITTIRWGASRNITIGQSTKVINGASNIDYTLAEIGAQSISDMTSYVLQSNLNTQLASYATLSGVQTFSSTITFTQAPIVPNPTLPAHAVNLNYLSTANVGSATKLQSARTINGTAFDGTANVTTTIWGTSRTITIGSGTNPVKNVNGGANVSWTLAEIGAVPISQNLPTDKTLSFSTNYTIGKYNAVLNSWVNVVLNGQGVNKTFLPIIEVSDDGVTWTNLNLTDTLKYFNAGSLSALNIPNNFFRFTFRTNESYNGYFYIGFRTVTTSPGTVVSGKYEHSNDAGVTWVENTFGSNSDQVSNVYNAVYFAVNNPSRQYHRLTVQKHSGQNIQLVQIMFLSNASFDVDRFTVSKTDLDDPQVKVSTNTTLSNSTYNRYVIIGTANLTLSALITLPDNFAITVIADGGNVNFATNGAFKGNNGKVILLNGGQATLRKENGTNNFYLKGDLT